ncbi:MAG: fructose-specific PTS transporter subunit EIIC [Ornithinimicrobium sp.]
MTTLLHTDLLLLDENLHRDKAAVVRALAEAATQDDRACDAQTFVFDALTRAEVVPQGPSRGTALLAFQSGAVEAPTLMIARLPSVVELDDEGRAADLVLLVAAPDGDDATHQQLLAHLGEALSWTELSDSLRAATTPADAAQLVQSALVTDTAPAGREPWGGRARRVLMTGVSYMIPFVAGGGLLIALGYLLGGYDITGPAPDIVNEHDVTNLPDPVELGLNHVPFDSPALAYLGALFFTVGATAFTLFIPAMAGYIAFAIAGRPGIAPGFVVGALAVDLMGFGSAQSGFLGAIAGGVMAGVVARWVGGWALAPWARGLKPVILVPVVTTAVCGVVMITALNRPLAALTRLSTEAIDSLNGGSMVLLGVVLGLMMAFDIGGPLNKTAYTFAVTGVGGATALANDAPQLQVMAAVMLAGMTPPLALAMATRVRPVLFSRQERESGKAAAALGAAFITEGAVPYAAADPLRVIPAIMAGSAVTGGVSMALGVTSRAPHGGVLVLFSVGDIASFVLALVAGVFITTVLVCVMKSLGTAADRT